MSRHARTILTFREVPIGFVLAKREIRTLCETSRYYYSRPEVHHRASKGPMSIPGSVSSGNSLIPLFQSAVCQVLHPHSHNTKGKDISGGMPNTDYQSSNLDPDDGCQILPLATTTHKALSNYCTEFPPELGIRHRKGAETIVGDGMDSLAKSPQKSPTVVQSRLSRTSHKIDSVVTGKNDSASRVYALQSWQVQKQALTQKFGSSGWAPRKRLSPDALEGIRSLHSQFPEKYTTPVLANHFQVSPEAIRRILKSKWRPNEDEEVERRERWNKRGESIWRQMVEIGIKPPKKWRDMGLRKRTVGMAVDDVSAREHLLGAWRYRSIRRNSDAISSWKRRAVPPAPLSERIL